LISNTNNRRVLVVGGTGMLMPLCNALPSNELILAARFISHSDTTARLSAEVMRVPLDYTNDESQFKFLRQIKTCHGLKFCILWVHSKAWGFSKRMIETVSRFPEPPVVVHVFGSSNRSNDLAGWSSANNTEFIPVQLGSVKTLVGFRWLTHQEISEQVIKAIRDNYPNFQLLKNISTKN
jgi:hypothetical protein